MDHSATSSESCDTQEPDQRVSNEFTNNPMGFGNDSDERYPIGGSLNNNMNNEMNGIILNTNGEHDLSRQYLKKSLEKIHGDKDSAEILAHEW